MKFSGALGKCVGKALRENQCAESRRPYLLLAPSCLQHLLAHSRRSQTQHTRRHPQLFLYYWLFTLTHVCCSCTYRRTDRTASKTHFLSLDEADTSTLSIFILSSGSIFLSTLQINLFRYCDCFLPCLLYQPPTNPSDVKL